MRQGPLNYLGSKCGIGPGIAPVLLDDATLIEPSATYAARPNLLVIVDTEEEFDWAQPQPFSRDATGIGNIKDLEKGQRLLERRGIRPTYVIDYPVASQEAGFRPLREWFSEGLCEVGAHLHPWVNPPFEEELSRFNSFAGNLTPALERAKLTRLTDTIEENFGYRPTIYRAGRYGIGPTTAGILVDLGYEIDTSVVPYSDYSGEGGPNFNRLSRELFWFGPGGRLLEIPLTVDWCGLVRRLGPSLGQYFMSRAGERLHLPALFARSKLLERIYLSPEGMDLAQLKRLTETLLALGTRVFVFSFHSPSLAPGNTPYVRTAVELDRFLGTIEEYCDFFLGTCGGTSISPHDLRAAITKAGKISQEVLIKEPSSKGEHLGRPPDSFQVR